MKLRTTLLFLFTSMLSVCAQQAQFNSYVTDAGDTLPYSSSSNSLAGPPLPSPLACPSSNNHATPYNQNNAQRGIMFDITALNNITINCFEINMAAGTSNVEVYYKVGTHVGFATTPGAWTLLGTAINVTSAGNNVGTAIPVTVNVSVTAGCTVAFYITRTTVGGATVQ